MTVPYSCTHWGAAPETRTGLSVSFPLSHDKYVSSLLFNKECNFSFSRTDAQLLFLTSAATCKCAFCPSQPAHTSRQTKPKQFLHVCCVNEMQNCTVPVFDWCPFLAVSLRYSLSITSIKSLESVFHMRSSESQTVSQETSKTDH